MSDSFTPEQIENMNRFFELINSSIPPMSRLQGEEEAAAAAARKASDSMDQMSKTIRTMMTDSIVSFSKATISTQEGLAKYGETVNIVSSSLSSVASGLGRFGFIIGGLITAIGAFTTSALEQNDNMIKAYSGLSELGNVTKDGIEGVRARLNEIGLASGEFEKFLEVLKPVTSTLVSFGGSVSNGVDSMVNVLSQFTGEGNELELSLNRIGYTSNQIRQGVTDYVMYQTKLGKAQGKTTDELTKGAHKYLLEMKGLQELTGLTREEQQKERDQILQDARFRLMMADMGEEGENMLNFMVAYTKQFGPEAASGLKDRILNMGSVTTQAAAESVMRNNKEFEIARAAAREGTASFGKHLDQITQNSRAAFGPIKNIAMMAENGAASIGYGNQMILGMLEKTKTPYQNHATAVRNMTNRMSTQGDLQDENYRREQEARAQRLLADEGLAYAGGTLVSVFNTLSTIIYSFNKMLAKAIDWITAHSGFMTPTDLSSKFKDASDEAKDKQKKEGYKPGKTFGYSRKRPEDGGVDVDEIDYKQSMIDQLRNNFGGKFAERTGGGDTDVALLELALKIKQRLPNFIITALNDVYHQENKPNSKHRVGKALDFALGYTPSEEEAQAIMKMLKEMGATNVINEYPKGKGHFHVEISDSGANPVELLGKNQTGWPNGDVSDYMKNGNSMEQFKQELVTQLLGPGQLGTSAGSNVADAFTKFNEKLDTLISEQRNSNTIQNEILQYARA